MMYSRYRLVSYLCGATLARVGDEMSGPAVLLLGVAAGGVATGSTALAALTISSAIGGPLLGAVLDRCARAGRTLALFLLAYAAGLALIGFTLGQVSVVLVMLLAAVTGLFGPAVSGGWSGRLGALVSPRTLERASSWDAVSFNAASLAGPALCGAVAVTAGPVWALGSAGIAVCGAASVAHGLPGATEAPAPNRLVASLRAGAAALIRSGALRRATVTSTVSYVGLGMLVACSPLLGLRSFGSTNTGAVLLAVLAASAMVSVVVVRRLAQRIAPDTVIAASVIVLAAALAMFALFTGPIAAVGAAVVAGVADGPQLAAVFAVRHREAPAHLRSQIFTTAASLKITALGAGAGLAGPLAQHSLPLALLTAAAVQLCALAANLTFRNPTVPQQR